MTVWSPAELAAFLASIEGNRNEALFRPVAMTGLRRSEVVGLRWSDVLLERSRPAVNQAGTVVDGDEVVDAPKTRRSRRVIDLDPATTSLLQRHRARRARRRARRHLFSIRALAMAPGDVVDRSVLCDQVVLEAAPLLDGRASVSRSPCVRTREGVCSTGPST